MWERGRNVAPARRALMLLSMAEPGLPASEVAAWSIGQRDARLLELRSRTFGTELSCVATCPSCGEQLELDFRVADILRRDVDDTPAGRTAQVGDFRIEYHLPTALDLARPFVTHTGVSPARQLLQRCVREVWRDGQQVSVEDLTDEAIDALGALMASEDPQAEVKLAVACPACGETAEVIFDIVSFFWRELDAWSQRLLHETHILARAYGWREADVFALSHWRRSFYLEQVQA